MRTTISAGLMLVTFCATSPALANDSVGLDPQEASRVEVAPTVMQEGQTGTADYSDSLFTQQVMIGGMIVGGAFVVGILATGTLATGIGAAGAAVLTYTFLP